VHRKAPGHRQQVFHRNPLENLLIPRYGSFAWRHEYFPIEYQELRHKVFNTRNSFTDILPYNAIAFNEGGPYNTTNIGDTNRLRTAQLICKRQGNTRAITLTQSSEATIKI
jgi:hypothetical protein